MLTQTLDMTLDTTIGLDKLPQELALRIKTTSHALATVKNGKGEVVSRWDFEDIYFNCHRKLSTDQAYLDWLERTTFEHERRQAAISTVSIRTSHVANLLYAHELALEREALHNELTQLLRQAAEYRNTGAAGNDLTSALVAIAHLLHVSSTRYTPAQALESLGNRGVSVERCLEAVHRMFQQARFSIGRYPLYSFNLPLFSFKGMSTEIQGLHAACSSARAACKAFQIPSTAWEQCSRHDLRLYLTGMDSALLGEHVGGHQHEERFAVVHHQLREWQALGFAAMNQSHQALKTLREAQESMDWSIKAATGSLTLRMANWELQRAPHEPEQILTYKAMVNCIAARFAAGLLDKNCSTYRDLREKSVFHCEDAASAYIKAAMTGTGSMT